MPLFKPRDSVCGRFVIDKLVGVGGMSEVYRGRDSKLNNRVVAIKALRARADVSLVTRNRVVTEVRSLSRLNHPHIATLYDVCTHENSDVIVMEFLEGMTLAELLRKGPLTESDALPYAIQLAEALAYAHRHGVIHCDIKPGNIVITPTGAKLLDFGVATLRYAETKSDKSGENETEIVTLIAGTPNYMSPEQQAGKSIDHRTDIYSLGRVLGQMLTGDLMPASGPSVVDRISSRPVRLVIKKCLERVPEDRWATADDLLGALRVVSEAIEYPVQPPAEKSRRITWPIAALFTVAFSGILFFWLASDTSRPAAEYGFLVSPPAGTHLVSFEVGGPPSLSPDGRTLAFIAAKDGSEETSIWLLPLSSVEPTPLRGTDDASHLFWSPDSQSLAFFSHEKLKRIDLPGGTPQDLCAAVHGRGGSWSKDQVIVFTPDFTEALYKVPARGGKPEKITDPKFQSGETSHRWPLFLPDGRRFVFFVRSDLPDIEGLYLGSLDTPGKYNLVANITSSAAYAKLPGNRSGYLVYSDGGFLVARGFSDSTGKFSGEPRRIAQLASPEEDTSVLPASISTDGTLVYAGGSVYRQSFQWVDGNGKETSSLEAYGQYRNPRLSPDRRKLAVESLEIRTGFASIWIFDLDRGLQNPFEQLSRAAFNPVWSPDGGSLVYAAFNGLWDLARRNTADKSDVKVLRKGGVQVATDWSDKGWIIYQEKGAGEVQQWDLGAFEVATGKTQRLVSSEKNESQGRLSPDGSWMAYTSNESGTDQIYIGRFPGMAPRFTVSGGQSNQPVWSSDGRELFYIAHDRDMMKVSVDPTQNPPRLSKPERLFALNIFPAAGFTAPVNYDVDSSSGRFIVATPPHLENLHRQITVKVNWLRQLSSN